LAIYVAKKGSDGEKVKFTGTWAMHIDNKKIPVLLKGEEKTHFKASFDCSKAGTVPEKVICSNAELANLDVQLAGAYKTALSACKNDVKLSQRDWLKTRDSCSSNIQCLKNSYKSRTETLQNCR